MGIFIAGGGVEGEKMGHYTGEKQVATSTVSAGGQGEVACPQDLLCPGGRWEDPWRRRSMGKQTPSSFWLPLLMFDWCPGALVTDQDPPVLAKIQTQQSPRSCF